MRLILHNTRVFFIKRMSRIPRYMMFGIGGIFLILLPLRLMGMNVLEQWLYYEILIIISGALITGFSLYHSAPNPKTDPY